MHMWQLACLLLSGLWAGSTGNAAAELNCSRAVVGLESTEPGRPAPELLSTCGVQLLRATLDSRVVEQLLESFLQLPAETVEALHHGQVREGRHQTHLPFLPPFSGLPLLGSRGQLYEPLAAALGTNFVLDLVTIVAVPPGTAAQEAHRDTSLAGSVAVHVPLHEISETMAPLGFCSNTLKLTSEDAQSVFREAILWRPKGESSQEAKRRLFCGGRQKTEVFNLTIVIEEDLDSTNAAQTFVSARDGRLGARIASFKTPEAEALGWAVNDEITHADGQRLLSADDWYEALQAAAGRRINVRVERPLPGPLPGMPGLLVGAPLAAGDALLYDSRTWHWGMANFADRTRYVLYINFKSSDTHAGVHPEAAGTAELHGAREQFQRRLLELRKALEDTTEL